MELNELKTVARAAALARRAGCDPAAGEAIGRHILARVMLGDEAAIAAVWPLPGEPDLRPLLAALHAGGHRVLLPQTPPRGQALVFRRWAPGVRMVAERFGTVYPDGPVDVPELILVPLLAFDQAGRRLGYGGGYYDRTLAALPDTPRLGFGFAALEVHEVPADAHDALLGLVVTENGVIRTTATRAPVPARRG